MKVKKGDSVMIISGKDRGRKGKILKVLTVKERIVIEGLNLVKKHRKPRKSGEKGQIVSIPASLHVSNVKFFCSACNQGTRISYILEKQKKFRICKKCKQKI